MKIFVEEILADIEWRVAELATLKSIPIKYSFSENHRNLHVKYSVPAIYAIWEGFVKKCFSIYSNHLNSLSILRSDISYALLTHHIDSECGFKNPRTKFSSKQKLIESLDKLFQEKIIIRPIVPTESNVNLKVLNQILERFCISFVEEHYSKGLDKLLLFRNKIAHGENSVTVDMDHVIEFVSLVENLMLDVAISVEKCERLETYKKQEYIEIER